MNSEERMKEIIFRNIDSKDYKVFLFGSRARWNHRPNSDYDIGIEWKKEIEYIKFLQLKRQLNDLPFIIDIIDFQTVDDSFKKIALKYTQPWN